MKKTAKTGRQRESRITPEQALDFLESFREMQAGKDEPTRMISIRVPGNVLRAYKIAAQAENRSYQSMMNQALREYLRNRK